MVSNLFVDLCQSRRYERWLRLDEGGTAYAWQWLEPETLDHPATIAYAGDNKPYPLYGRGFANRVLYVPPDEREPFFGFGYPVVRNPQPLTSESWLEKMRAWGVDYLLTAQDPISGTFPQEDVWAQQDPQHFTLLYTRPRARIYRVMIP